MAEIIRPTNISSVSIVTFVLLDLKIQKYRSSMLEPSKWRHKTRRGRLTSHNRTKS